MDYLAALNTLVQRFSVVPLPGGSGLEPTLRIDPPADALDPNPTGLALSETVQRVTQVEVPINIDLAFLGKWVRSTKPEIPADPATEDPIGGMPVADPLVALGSIITNLPPASLMNSDLGMAAVAGVPEVLGRIKGAITQTVERLTEVLERRPIRIALRWRILDESTPGSSTPVSGVQYRTDPQATWQNLPALLEFPPPSNPAAPVPRSLSLRFPLVYSELTSGTPDVRRFSVRSSVRLTVQPPGGAAAVATGWLDLPPVPLLVPAIPVPTILVLCEHPDFAGRKLVLVPSNSLIGAAIQSGSIGIGPALSLVASALQSLAPANSLTGFLAASLGGSANVAATVLKGLAPSSGQTIVAAQSRVDDLSASAFVFDPGGFLGVGRFTGEDMASSIICIGRPGTVFDLFQDRNLSERITRLQITLDGSLGCAIRTLVQRDPTPDIVYGSGVTSFSPVWPHEDRISSLSFTGPPARFQPA